MGRNLRDYQIVLVFGEESLDDEQKELRKLYRRRENQVFVALGVFIGYLLVTLGLLLFPNPISTAVIEKDITWTSGIYFFVGFVSFVVMGLLQGSLPAWEIDKYDPFIF